jgi:hypothetical protein
LRSGHFAIYQVLSSGIPDPSPTNPRSTSVRVKFVKVLSKTFEIQRPEEGERSAILAEQKRISRVFVPFTTELASGAKYSGAFFTGENPSWIVGSDKGGVQIHPSGHSLVNAFTPSSLWESTGDFLLYTEEVCLVQCNSSYSDSPRVHVCWNGYQSISTILPFLPALFLVVEHIRTFFSIILLISLWRHLLCRPDSPHMTKMATEFGNLMVCSHCLFHDPP